MLPTDLLPLLPDLAVFAHVVETGNFSAAARQLGSTPSTISRQMRRLERALGTRLLERSTRSLRLTESGERVYRHGQQMLEAASHAVDAASHLSEQPRGRVSLSAPISVAKNVIHPLIPEFLRAYPEVDVQLLFVDHDVDPIRDHVDIVIRPTSTPPLGLAARRIGSVRWAPCASPAYLRARGTPATPDDLARHDCLYLGETADDNRWTFLQGGCKQTIEVRGRYIANDVEARREAALQGWGIASLPAFAIGDDLQSGRLTQVLPDWVFEPRAYSGPVWVLYPSNRFLPPKVRVLIDWLAQRMPV